MVGAHGDDRREGSILDAFVDLADSLVDHYDPLDFLYRLLDHSVPLVNAEAAAVLLHLEGRLHLVASSSEESEAVGLFELQHDQGPARDAFHAGEVIRADGFADIAERWPKFADAASPYDWSSSYAVPLRLRNHVAGSFVIFWSNGSRPTEEDAKLLRGFTDVATIAVLQRRAIADVEKINDQLHAALESRIKIEQAKGMIAQSSGASIGTAFKALRDHARSTNQRLSEIAGAVVSGDLNVDDLAQPVTTGETTASELRRR